MVYKFQSLGLKGPCSFCLRPLRMFQLLHKDIWASFPDVERWCGEKAQLRAHPQTAGTAAPGSVADLTETTWPQSLSYWLSLSSKSTRSPTQALGHSVLGVWRGSNKQHIQWVDRRHLQEQKQWALVPMTVEAGGSRISAIGWGLWRHGCSSHQRLEA